MASHLQLRRQSLALVFALTGIGCGDAPTPALGDHASSANNSAYTTPAKDGSDAGSSEDGVIVEADTPCTRMPGDGVKLVDATDAPRFNRLGMVGNRRFASSEENILVFDADGSNAGDSFRPSGADLVATAARGSVLAAASISGSGEKFTRYDSDGSKLNSITLDTKGTPGDPALAIGASNNSFLVVRARGTVLRGVEIGSSASATDPIDFGSGTFGAAISVATANDTSGFAVVWAGQASEGKWHLRFARWSATKSPSIVLSSTSPIRVSRLVPTSIGFAALVNDADVVMLDANGKLVGQVHRYAGVSYAWDLASNGTQVAMVAKRTSGEPMIRTLDASGAPSGAWICLAESLGNDVGGAAVDVDATKKWAIVYSAPDGSAHFTTL